MAYTLKDIMAMSMGHQVALMNSLFTRKQGDAPSGSKNAINQHSYTVSEWEETKEALKHGYVSDELRDGIADMFTTLIGSIWRAGNDDMFLFDVCSDNLQTYEPIGSPNNISTERAQKLLKYIEDSIEHATVIVSAETTSVDDLIEIFKTIAMYLIKYALYIGVNPHADLSQVTLANISKLCQSQDALERTYTKYKAIGVELYHTEVEPGVFAVFAKGTQQGTDGKMYESDKFLKSADWFEPFFPSLTTESALSVANMSAAQIQLTPKADLVDENGNPLI